MLLYLNNFGSNEKPYAVSGRVGSAGIPMFTHVSTPADQVDPYSGADCTTTGPVCGQCSEGCGRTIRHASVAHIRACWDALQYCETESAAEWPLIRAGWL